MSEKSKEFLEKMLIFFPSVYEDYSEGIKKYGEVLETVVMEDIFMPKILELLKENRNVTLLNDIFEYFEEVLNCNDSHMKNILSTTVLEILGNEQMTLDMAKIYMRPKTLQIQLRVDEMLGRV